MIASDMPNTNNANAQLFHRSLSQSTPKAFAGQRLKVSGHARQVGSARCADRTPQRSVPTVQRNSQQTIRKSAQYPAAAGCSAASPAREFWLYPEVFAACRLVW